MAIPRPPGGDSSTGPWWVNTLTNTIVYSMTRPGASRGPSVEYIGFSTRADAKAYVASNPGGQTGLVTAPDKGSLQLPHVPNPLSGIAAVGDFFNRLTDPHTWLRVAEAGIGATLVYVAARSMFPSQIGAIAGPVKNIAKKSIGAAA